jgi:hypothetical protein
MPGRAVQKQESSKKLGSGTTFVSSLKPGTSGWIMLYVSAKKFYNFVK